MVRVRSLRFVVTWILACCAVGQAQAKDFEPASPKTAKAQSAPRKSKVDLRPDFEKRRLGVRQQGQRGACQVFAFVGVLEYQLSKSGKPVDLSEQFLMWATNDANEFDRVDGFNRDWLTTGIKKNGICLESQMPYVPRNEAIAAPSDEAVHEGLKRVDCKVTSVKHWSDEVGFTDEVRDEIMRLLAAKQPVTATLSWPMNVPDKEMVDARNFMIDRSVEANRKNGHGVVLVGYCVDKKVEGGGYFIARNSWGEKFADRGYVGVTFDYARKYGIDAYYATLALAGAKRAAGKR